MPQKPEEKRLDHSPETTESSENLDRRQVLAGGGASLAALFGGLFTLSAAAQRRGGEATVIVGPSGPYQPGVAVPLCQDPAATSLPSHVTNTSPYDPNSFAQGAWVIASGLTNGCLDPLLAEFEAMVDANTRAMADSQLVDLFYEADQAGTMPTTIVEFVTLFLKGLMPEYALTEAPESSLCIEGPLGEGCIDTGCAAKNGKCWDVPAILEEIGVGPCECVLKPKPWQIGLAALILLILVATPGPDEIPAILAALGRIIIKPKPIPIP